MPGLARDRDDDYYRRGGRSNGVWQRFGSSPVRSALRNLESVASRNRLSGHDRDHARDGIERLRRFDDRLRTGRWDGGAIDKAIEDVKHLSEADRLNPRDRAMLRDDLYALRDFRANRGNASYGGYRNDGSRWPY
jgi:hypothetical protein